MATHCKLGDIQAIVYINKPIKERLKFKDCPIEVTVTANVKGNVITINADIERSNSHNPNQTLVWTDSEGISTDKYSLKFLECGNGGSCGANSPNTITGEKYYAIHIVKNGIDIGNKFFPAGVYSASIIDIVYSTFGQYTLKVITNSGSILSRVYDSEPQYTVTCGEECPKGYLKCNSTNYPGYCCLPCNEIAGEIKAIANQVRRLNNG